MSALQKSFARAKLATLPPFSPVPSNMSVGEEDVDEEVDPGEREGQDSLRALPSSTAEDDSSSASSASSTGTIKPETSKHLFAGVEGFVSFSRLRRILALVLYICLSSLLSFQRSRCQHRRSHDFYVGGEITPSCLPTYLHLHILSRGKICFPGYHSNHFLRSITSIS